MSTENEPRRRRLRLLNILLTYAAVVIISSAAGVALHGFNHYPGAINNEGFCHDIGRSTAYKIRTNSDALFITRDYCLTTSDDRVDILSWYRRHGFAIPNQAAIEAIPAINDDELRLSSFDVGKVARFNLVEDPGHGNVILLRLRFGIRWTRFVAPG